MFSIVLPEEKNGWRRRPLLQFRFFICFVIILNNNITVGERGEYVGCFVEKIDLYKTPVFAGNVESCLEMCESSYFRYAVLSSDKCACSSELESDKLDIAICNIRCTRNKSQFCGGVNSHSYYDTDVKISGPPTNFRRGISTNTTITVHWNQSQQPDSVTSFLIKATVIKSFANYPLFEQPEWIVQSESRQFSLDNLHPATQYNISISAMCNIEHCGTAYLVAETLIGFPDPPPEIPKIIKETENTITVDVYPGINNNGPISYYRLVVLIIDNNIQQPFDESLLKDYYQSVEDGTPYYITAQLEFQNTTRRFVVGNKRTYLGYYNAPLPPNSHAHISLGIVSVYNGETRVKYSMATHEQHNRGKAFMDTDDNQSSVVALSVACVIFGVLLVASIFSYCFLRLKTGNRRQRLSDTHELAIQGPIVEVVNNGYVAEDFVKTNFQTQLNQIVENLDPSQKFARNAIRLNIDDILGQGNFGEVISAKLYTNTDTYDSQVHVVSDDMDSQDQAMFLKDLNELIRIMPHEKFLSFFGVSASPDWFYVIFERPVVHLKKRLVEGRLPPNIDNTRFSSITEDGILQWIFDISVAMEYLEINKILHKQLCSYNVYVTNYNQIKLSIFGPVLYQEQSGKMIDVTRWQAPEVLRFQHHSTKSDVWSFGCVAWECCCLGATLYANITSQDLLPRIKNGGRPEQPSFVFGDLYQILLNCWQLEPSERPDFEELAFNVRQILTSPKHALCFDRHDSPFIPYYLPLLEVQN